MEIAGTYRGCACRFFCFGILWPGLNVKPWKALLTGMQAAARCQCARKYFHVIGRWLLRQRQAAFCKLVITVTYHHSVSNFTNGSGSRLVHWRFFQPVAYSQKKKDRNGGKPGPRNERKHWAVRFFKGAESPWNNPSPLNKPNIPSQSKWVCIGCFSGSMIAIFIIVLMKTHWTNEHSHEMIKKICYLQEVSLVRTLTVQLLLALTVALTLVLAI